MGATNQSNSSAHSKAFHEEQLPIFDAYVTNELDPDEKAQIEQQLRSCQECQHLLEEVTRLRHALGTLSETESSSAAGRVISHPQSIVHTVLERIGQEEKRRNSFTTGRARQEQASFHPPSAYHPALLARRRARSIYLSLVAALCCGLLIVGFIIVFRNTSSSGNKQISVPPPTVWTTRQQSMLVQNSAGIFALKQIEITTKKEFRFYYVFKSSHQGTIHVTAISSLNTGQRQFPVTLSTTVLSLGTIDGISVGVIRLQYLDRVGQTIMLSITLPGEAREHWQLTPLKQLLIEPHPEGGGYYGFPVDQHLFPEIIWSGPVGGPQSMVSLFKNAVGTRYIFLEVDYAGKIVVITREQCIQLVGEQICQ